MSETKRRMVYECHRCGRIVEELLSGEPSDKKLFCDCYIDNKIFNKEMIASDVPAEMNREEAQVEILKKRPTSLD